MENSSNVQQTGKGQSPRKRVWFITGASSGFGRVLTEHLLQRNESIVATARDPGQLKDLEQNFPANIQILRLDVTEGSQIEQATADALSRFGHIDVLVNNAGYGVLGAVEEVNSQEYMPMFDTNVFGLINVTKSFLPQFRKQMSGHIVNFSSIGGLIGSAGWGYYNATKFAIEGFSEALAAELAPLGIHVTVVEPGPFRTDFLGRSGVVAQERIPDYAPTAGKAREYLETQSGKQPGDPRRAAEAVVAAVDSAQPPKHLLLGKSALKRFRTRLQEWTQDLDRWEATTVGADFPDGE